MVVGSWWWWGSWSWSGDGVRVEGVGVMVAGVIGGDEESGGRCCKLVLQLCEHTKHAIFYLDYMFA